MDKPRIAETWLHMGLISEKMEQAENDGQYFRSPLRLQPGQRYRDLNKTRVGDAIENQKGGKIGYDRDPDGFS